MNARGWLAGVWLMATLGCGGPKVGEVVVSSPSGTAPLAPYDAGGVRLRAARSLLAEVLGRGLRIEIDAALSEGLRSQFEQQLISGIEELVRSIRVLKAEHPETFARLAPKLERVACVYRVTAQWPSASFELETKTLTIAQGAHPTAVIPRGLVVEALLDADHEGRAQRFATAQVRSVPARDRRAYFEYLTASRPGYGILSLHRQREAAREQGRDSRDLTDSAEAALIATVAELHQAIGKSDAELSAEVRQWLLDWPLNRYSSWYSSYRDDLAQLSADAPFHGAERTYMRWLDSQLQSLDEAEVRKVADKLFYRVDDNAYPGVDRFAFGLKVITRWQQAGRPSGKPNGAESGFERVLCPRDQFDTKMGAQCYSAQGGWLAYATMDAARIAKLARELERLGDDALTESVVWALHSTLSGPAVRREQPDRGADLLFSWSPNSTPFRVAFRRLVLSGRSHFEKTANRLWAAQPELRGGLVLFFARQQVNQYSYHADDYWQRFPKSYGGPIDERTFKGLMSYDGIALELLPQLWLGLGRGYSRVEPWIARFDAMLPDTSKPENTAALRGLSGVVDRLCKEGGSADLARLHTAINQRSAARPAEKIALSTLQRYTAPGGCKQARPSSASGSSGIRDPW